jgi:hypothetical protein
MLFKNLPKIVHIAHALLIDSSYTFEAVGEWLGGSHYTRRGNALHCKNQKWDR